MNNEQDRFFFLTTYDNISGALLASILNEHPDISCSTYYCDPFLTKLYLSEGKHNDKIIDNFIVMNIQFIGVNIDKTKRFSGNAQRFAAFELHHRILVEKVKHGLRKVNITISPQLRINLLIKCWLEKFQTEEFAVNAIENRLNEMKNNNHYLFDLYIFHYFYAHVLDVAINEKIDINDKKNRLFLLALARVITNDSADLPTPSKHFAIEKLINNEDNFLEFAQYLTQEQLQFDDLTLTKIQEKLKSGAIFLEELQNKPWLDWQQNLLQKYLHLRLHTIYYPHIDKPLIHFYSEMGYELTPQTVVNKKTYSKLLSIQLNSNRPAQLIAYFDNIEETADNPSDIEVLVNIDDNDTVMEDLIIREIHTRKFTLKYITTERPKSFCDLWKPINQLLKITDPNAYFLLNISDEMLFATNGWDTLLKKYVGFFPDHIFRLRASRNKFRNYFDRWECSFGQDSIPITTKKWVDIGGDWNPCFGPDSFQQLIAFYLAKEGQFSSTNYLRELPVIDIQFHGDVPSIGMVPEKAWKHTSDHLKAMQICQSYPMQLEAKRRAMLLKANMISVANQLTHYDIIDNKSKKLIQLINQEDKKLIANISYKLSWLSITLTNEIRKLKFNSYFGGGKEANKFVLLSFAGYLKAKYSFFNSLYNKLKHYKLLIIQPNILAKLPNYIKRELFSKKTNKFSKEFNLLKESYKNVCLENEKLQNQIHEQHLKPTLNNTVINMSPAKTKQG